MKPIILLFMILAGIFPCHASGTPEKTEDGKPVKFCGFLLEQAGRRQKITFNFLAFFPGKDTFLAIHYGRIEDHGLPGEETAGVTHFCRSRPGPGGGKKRQHGLERGSRHFH